ncbi:MAG: DUF6653 family protein [Pseudomonadota bacterium]
MDIFKSAERLMAMDDAAWARHANPWSGYTRFLGSIPLFFALWSMHWIGWWSLVPIGLMMVWTFVNPRLFPPPTQTTSWVTRGVLGERVFLNRKQIAIPAEHLIMARITTGISALFFAGTIWAFVQQDLMTAIMSWSGTILGKTWFVDRMAWLWDDMKASHPVYAAWDRADWTASFAASHENTTT